MWAVKLFVVLGIVFLSLTAYSTTEKAPEWIQRLSGAFEKWTFIFGNREKFTVFTMYFMIPMEENNMAYAEKTTVSVSKTKADIEELVQRAGAGQFVSGYKDDVAVIGFSLADRQIRFVLPLPDKKDNQFWFTPERHNKRTEQQAYTAWEQSCRSRWRALYLIIKAKLEAVESGISTVEREFFYDVVLPDGRTIGEFMAPQIETAYQSGQMPPMLPMLGN